MIIMWGPKSLIKGPTEHKLTMALFVACEIESLIKCFKNNPICLQLIKTIKTVHEIYETGGVGILAICSFCIFNTVHYIISLPA